ncbi:hypothetical protein BJX70DRAFT_71592 [Aspergillus crustosus]
MLRTMQQALLSFPHTLSLRKRALGSQFLIAIRCRSPYLILQMLLWKSLLRGVIWCSHLLAVPFHQGLSTYRLRQSPLPLRQVIIMRSLLIYRVGPLCSAPTTLQCPSLPTPAQPSGHSMATNQPSMVTPITPVFQCKWSGCQSSTIFRREVDIVRHLRSIHLSPDAHHCLEKNCRRSFGRKDHLREHKRRCHRQA